MGSIEIYHVSSKSLLQIIDHRTPNGCFLTKKNGKWIAVDNTTGDTWIEEFNHKDEAVSWLRREFEIGDNY